MIQKLYAGSANDHVLQSFEVFFSGKVSFFFICVTVLTRSQTGKNFFFFRNLDQNNSRLFTQER